MKSSARKDIKLKNYDKHRRENSNEKFRPTEFVIYETFTKLSLTFSTSTKE